MLVEVSYNPISLSELDQAITMSNGNFLNYLFMISFFFGLRRGFMSWNVILRTSKYTDPCQFCLTSSEEILFQFICFLQSRSHSSSVQSLLVMLTASTYTDWNHPSVFSHVSSSISIISSIFLNLKYTPANLLCRQLTNGCIDSTSCCKLKELMIYRSLLEWQKILYLCIFIPAPIFRVC